MDTNFSSFVIDKHVAIHIRAPLVHYTLVERIVVDSNGRYVFIFLTGFWFEITLFTRKSGCHPGKDPMPRERDR